MGSEFVVTIYREDCARDVISHIVIGRWKNKNKNNLCNGGTKSRSREASRQGLRMLYANSITCKHTFKLQVDLWAWSWRQAVYKLERCDMFRNSEAEVCKEWSGDGGKQLIIRKRFWRSGSEYSFTLVTICDGCAKLVRQLKNDPHTPGGLPTSVLLQLTHQLPVIIIFKTRRFYKL